jgi:hypothetical protein
MRRICAPPPSSGNFAWPNRFSQGYPATGISETTPAECRGNAPIFRSQSEEIHKKPHHIDKVLVRLSIGSPAALQWQEGTAMKYY